MAKLVVSLVVGGGDPEHTSIDLSVFRQWINGVQPQEVAQLRRGTTGFDVRTAKAQVQFHRLWSSVLYHVHNQYRMFSSLEHCLTEPRLMAEVCLYPMTGPLQSALLADYYSFDAVLFRQLLGKRPRKDMQGENFAATGVRPLSASRQLSNLYKMYHVFHEDEGKESEQDKKSHVARSGSLASSIVGGNWDPSKRVAYRQASITSVRSMSSRQDDGSVAPSPLLHPSSVSAAAGAGAAPDSGAGSGASIGDAADVRTTPSAGDQSRRVPLRAGAEHSTVGLVRAICDRFLLEPALAEQYAMVLFLARYRFETFKNRLGIRLSFADLAYFVSVLTSSWSVGSDPFELDLEFLGQLKDLKSSLVNDGKLLDHYAHRVVSSVMEVIASLQSASPGPSPQMSRIHTSGSTQQRAQSGAGGPSPSGSGGATLSPPGGAGGGALTEVVALGVIPSDLATSRTQLARYVAPPRGATLPSSPSAAPHPPSLLRAEKVTRLGPKKVSNLLKSLAQVAVGLGSKTEQRNLFVNLLEAVRPLQKSELSAAEVQELLVQAFKCADNELQSKPGHVLYLWARFLRPAAKICMVLYRRCVLEDEGRDHLKP